MNIGFDVDGVLTDIRDFIVRYGSKYLNKEVVNENGFSMHELFDCTEKEELAFWNRYLLKYITTEIPRINSAEVINELGKNNRIFIITLRVLTDKDNITGKVMRYIIKKWLQKNNINYDEIVFSSNNDKSIDILNNYIDVMVEDDPKNILKLSQYTKVICMNEKYNQNIDGKNIYRAYDMNDVKNIIDGLSITYNKKLDDEIKPLSGLPSIDKPWYKYYTYGQVSRKLPKQKIYDYLKYNNKNNLNAEALSYFGNIIKFDSLFNEIEKCAKSLKEIGVKKGDIVTICSPNVPEGVIAFYAINRVGAIASMIHPLSKSNFIKTRLNETKSNVMFFIDVSYDEIKTIINDTSVEHAIALSAKDSMPLLTKIVYTNSLKKTCSLYKEDNKANNIVSWDDFKKIGKSYQEEIDSAYEQNAPAVILNTGGTTGVSKGALLSNDNFNAMVYQYKMKAKFNKGDKMVALMPLFHGFGLCNSIHMPMCMKASSILIPQFDSKRFYNMLLKEKPNHIMGVPTLWKGIQQNTKYKNKDLSFLNGYCVSGGDHMSNAFENKTNDFFEEHNAPIKITKGYGLTEIVSSATFTFEDSNEIGSIGIPLVDTSVKIVDPETNEELGYNQEGEICISGPTVMLKYFNNEEETQKDLRLENNKIWLHTGDIGYVNENGMFFYTDRLKRLIIVSGVNVYPSKIEKIIEEHPDVLHCACISMNHQYKQNVPKVYIILKEGKVLTTDLKLELLKLCSEKIPNKYYKVYDIEQLEDFPKTLLGKIDYKQLQQFEKDKENNADAKLIYKKRK